MSEWIIKDPVAIILFMSLYRISPPFINPMDDFMEDRRDCHNYRYTANQPFVDILIAALSIRSLDSLLQDGNWQMPVRQALLNMKNSTVGVMDPLD